MFHHFHDEARHSLRSQGSISVAEFRGMLEGLRQAGKAILNPPEWRDRLTNGTLREKDICITFDDGLKCQFDVALPALESMGIQAFWLCYTSPLQGQLEELEVYRYFRFSRFATVDEFYEAFFRALRERSEGFEVDYAAAERTFADSGYLEAFAFYTKPDRKFRYFRDVVLGPEKYFRTMDGMLLDCGFDGEQYRDVLWMTAADLKTLASLGHEVGLHSHTHPTDLRSLSRDGQYEEYRVNRDILIEATGKEPWSASYPCGSFNDDTDPIMREFGIVCGFDAVMHEFGDALHIPRLDHAYLPRTTMETTCG